jgi:putative phosphoesterase
MKIGALSDTHLTRPNQLLDFILDVVFKDTDLILHAGDIVSRHVLERLQERDTIAVCGNMDDFDVIEAVPQTRIVSAAGKRIGLIHGWGAKQGLENRILEKFQGKNLDLIVYGHSHVPYWGKMAGVDLFNPGSAFQNRYLETGTVGIIDIENGTVDAKILTVRPE